MSKAMPEDLIHTVIAADDLRRKARGLPSTRAAMALEREKKPWARELLEPFFNLLGIAWGQLMFFMPWPFRKGYIQWVLEKMAGHAPEENPALPGKIQDTVRLTQEVKAKTGTWPALFILTSHPDTEGPLQWLRFELMRQGLQIADAVIEARKPGAWFLPHPRCFLAIDPFALDTVSMPVGSIYSGWMHRIYLAWDRQSSSQFWIQRHLLLRNTDYRHIGWRLLRWLKNDTPVAMVLSGGLPYNARLLYAAREFVQRLRPPRWKVSKRQAQKDLMMLLMKPEGNLWPAEEGQIPPPTARAIKDAMSQWGLPAADIEAAYQDLEKEFKRPVPYRARLFNVLLDRLVAKGKPLILVPVSHASEAPHARIGDPVLIQEPMDADRLAEEFSRFF